MTHDFSFYPHPDDLPLAAPRPWVVEHEPVGAHSLACAVWTSNSPCNCKEPWPELDPEDVPRKTTAERLDDLDVEPREAS